MRSLIVSLRARAKGGESVNVRRACRMAARYLEALVEAGEFGARPRYFAPGVHFEEFEPGDR